MTARDHAGRASRQGSGNPPVRSPRGEHRATRADTAPVWPHSDAPRHRAPDPAEMPPKARLAELGALLALGYRRHRLHQKELADAALSERSCDSVDSNETPNGTEEVA